MAQYKKGPHQSEAWALQQLQIDERAQKQRQLDVLSLDTYNRLSAEVERLVNYCSKAAGTGSIPKSFSHHLSQITDDPICMMLNIEGFLDSLDGFHLLSKKDGTKVPLFPSDYKHDAEVWNNKLWLIKEKLKDNPNLELPYQILCVIIYKIYKGQPITSLPAEVSNSILSQKQRDAYCEDMVKNGQTGVLAIVKASQNVAAESQRQMEVMDKKGHDPKANKQEVLNFQDQKDDLYGMELKQKEDQQRKPEQIQEHNDQQSTADGRSKNTQIAKVSNPGMTETFEANRIFEDLMEVLNKYKSSMDPVLKSRLEYVLEFEFKRGRTMQDDSQYSMNKQQ
jgi:hypothetical protein